MSSERNYLLDYRESGDLGPLKVIAINFAVSEEDYKTTVEWLREKILRNEREFTLGEYGPFKEGPAHMVLVADPTEEQKQEIKAVAEDGSAWAKERLILQN